MAHVGVERFGAGHGEHDRAQHQEPGESVIEQEANAVPRVQRAQDGWLAADLEDPERRDRPEPHEHDRAEDAAQPRGAVLLEEEQQEEDEQGGRKHVRFERRGRDLETLGGAEHGDGRCDDAVAIEQGGAEQPQPDEQAQRRRWRSRASSAMMPPSPRLSRRMTKAMYFTLTIRRSDQTMSDSTP